MSNSMTRRWMLAGAATLPIATRSFAGETADRRGFADGKKARPVPGMENVKALLFDVFGTVVDWRGSLIEDFQAWSRKRGIQADWVKLVDSWRDTYAPAIAEIRKHPGSDFRKLDELNREGLEKLIAQFGISGLNDADVAYLVDGWHRLRPWADSIPGLTRLKSRFTIAPLSNGNVSLLADMAKRAKLPWDLVLSGELYHHYKPDPEVYVGAVRTLGLKPGEAMMVAAHNFDLTAAQKVGLKTAFVVRPKEAGPSQTQDLKAEGQWDIECRSLKELADVLGA